MVPSAAGSSWPTPAAPLGAGFRFFFFFFFFFFTEEQAMYQS
ncbi:hypothetical protein WME79_22480 [Sorangium sp. So ce726]